MTEDKPVKIFRPMSFSNAAELEVKCKEYFTIWEEKSRPLTVVGLAVYLDVCKETLQEYGRGTYDHVDEEFSRTVKRAKDYIENAKWEGALQGKYQHSVAIFDLKNNHGCTDKTEISTQEGKPLQTETKVEYKTAEDAVKAYQLACKE